MLLNSETMWVMVKLRITAILNLLTALFALLIHLIDCDPWKIESLYKIIFVGDKILVQLPFLEKDKTKKYKPFGAIWNTRN